MTILEALLSLYGVAGVLTLALWRHSGRALWTAVAALGALLLLAGIVTGGHRVEAAPLILVSIAVAALAFRRSRWDDAPPPRRRRRLAAGLRFMVAVVVALIVLADAAFMEIFDPLSNAPIEELSGGVTTQDFSHETWTHAFEKLNDHLSRAYAMGSWKRIDWNALYDATRPRIADAERTGNRAAYYLAMREYLWSLHDGHVNLSGSDDGLRAAALRGGYGLLLTRLDDGRTIAHLVIAGGPAGSAGMQWGATVLSWDGVSIDEAVARTPVVWYWNPPATQEGRQLAQLRLLTRASMGTRTPVVFQNPGDAKPRSATLAAVDDNFATLRLGGPPQSLALTDTNIDWHMLPEHVGYVKIRAEMPTVPQLLPDRVVRDAAAAFIRAGAKGVVMDVRGNSGGADKLVPRMMGFFVDTRQFYLHTTYYDETTSRFERQPDLTLWTEPRTPHFAGPIALLVDEWCGSACEGFALIARKHPHGHVVGFHGTHGSFGMSGAEVLMPGELTVEYSGGQSLDENGAILIDGDWRLEGGISPDVRVPITAETVNAQFREGRDIVLETAVRTLTTSARQ